MDNIQTIARCTDSDLLKRIVTFTTDFPKQPGFYYRYYNTPGLDRVHIIEVNEKNIADANKNNNPSVELYYSKYSIH